MLLIPNHFDGSSFYSVMLMTLVRI
uniref:Uncharacterized protein n=1 Tax=Rhizophora mucronata TaxID=61149 RepID=A0A2P2QVD9_RHIMU